MDVDFCQRCNKETKFIGVVHAARIVDVDRRTIYGFIKKKRLFAIKRNTLKICVECLLQPL